MMTANVTENASAIAAAIRAAGITNLRSADRRADAAEALRPLLFGDGFMPIAIPDCAPARELTSVGRYARWAADVVAGAVLYRQRQAARAAANS